jgi:hypothetical protein
VVGEGQSDSKGLRQVNPVLAGRYVAAFEELFVLGNPESVIHLTEDLLNGGGVPFEGYRAEAPSAWRR